MEDRDIIKKLGLIQPSELMNVDDLEKYQEHVKKVQKQIPYDIGGLKKKKGPRWRQSKNQRKRKRKRNN